MCSIGVVVNAPEERGRSILADVLHDQVATTRMFVDQLSYIVNEASYDDQWPLQRLLPDCNIELADAPSIRRDEKTYNFPS